MDDIKKSFIIFSIASAACLSQAAFAEETGIFSAKNYYLSGAAIYSRVDHSDNDSKGGGAELNLGYTINSSWSIELSYLDALSETSSEPDYDSRSLYTHGYELNGVMLSILGKTSLAEGELYYRAGIMRTDVNSTTFYETDNFNCDSGLVSGYVVNWDDDVYNFFKCEVSEKKNVALFGLGYKYDFNDNWFFRTELRRLFMRDSFYVDNLSVGLGYRF